VVKRSKFWISIIS